ncbi:FtsW/RodA/SpoVE family cell cycle protein [Paenibacillus sp. GCM10027629]|uniref:FtsW/RodA/SpoVE family cell cycle protein n=1 Tax=Paenibacillus sp. GCM10027629 TaxID=3273414 RepID=UPI00362EA752
MNEALLEHEAVVEYLNQVCRQIKVKEVHRDIRMELLSHLSELVDDKMMEGLSQEVAIQQALVQMGNPVLLGKQLHTAHKPVMAWGLLALVAIFVGLGLLAMYAMNFAIDRDYSGIFLSNQLFYVTIGMLVMVMIYFFDYRKWQRYSWWLYGVAIGLMVLCQGYGRQMNGMKQFLSLPGGFYVNIYEFVPYLFIIAFAGNMVTTRKKYDGQQVNTWMTILFYLILPGYFYVTAPSIAGLIIHSSGIIVMHVCLSRRVKLLLGSVTVFFMMGLAALLFMHDKGYTITRISGWLNPMQDPSGSGYFYITISKVLRSAGMWGQGFGVRTKLLPNIQNDMLFPYLVYSLGWGFGLLLIILVCIMLWRIVKLTLELMEPFGRALVIGLSSILCFKFFYNMLMSVGLLPITSINMPFVSYGGTMMVVNLAVVGIILSVYRRKKMLSQLAK